MINFLSNWIEQIAIAVIIVSIFELVLPKGNLKKYIKVVLGIYIIFCMISPFVNSSALYDIGNIDLEKYTKNNISNTTNVNQESMDLRLQNLYIEEMKRDISKKVEDAGYKLSKCDIDADLNNSSENAGIHRIGLTISRKNIEKVEIDFSNKINEENTNEEEQIKEDIARYYEIDKNLINVKIK